MTGMRTLIRLFRELEDQLARCSRCGLCQSVCPLFAETGREADVARGKLALLSCLSQELFTDPQGVADRLNRCLLCGSCAANCPGGVRVLDIFLAARAILTGYLGLSPVKKIIFRGLLARPGRLDRLMELGARCQGLFIQPVDDLLGSSCSRFLSPIFGDRHFKPLAPVPFHQQTPSLAIPPAAGKPTVAFFVGCLIDKVFPGVAQAVLTVLRHHGVGVFLPDRQGCCGLPALSAGDIKTFQTLVGHNLERFRGQPFDYLITACATCTAAIKTIWPLMAGEANPEQRAEIALWAEKAIDISEFLVDQLGLSSTPGESAESTDTVTYHDPCHLKKSLGVSAQPRVLLRQNSRRRLVEMAEADRCCGCGGSFNLQNYDLSAAIGRRKRDAIMASGAGLVATGCPACMLQITDLLSQAGIKIPVQHTIEVYAKSLRD